jgi:outer membrane protein insertion porin family
MYVSAAKTFKYRYLLVTIAAFSILFSACTTVKNYPANKAFVYQTNINIEGKYSTDEKKQLTSQLDEQLHDSISTRKERKFLFWHTLKKPPVYDTLNIGKSIIYMEALLHSLGYARDSIGYAAKIDTVGDQYRTTLNFTVVPGKLIRFDSIWYNLLDSVPYSPQIDTLQQLTLQSLNQGLIKKGEPFSKPVISSELDRLSDVYRNHGYLRFSREQMLAVWDTVGINLLRFTTDPTEQLQQLQALRRRRENPTADIEIRLRPEPDTSRLVRYFVGTVKIYPDFNSDTALFKPRTDVLTRNRYEFISYKQLFKPKKLIHFIYLDRGDLYRQSNYLKTQNKFNAVGSWRLVTINQLPRPGQDTVDFEIRLIPAKQYSTGINFDVSRNQGDLSAEGNLIGLGTTFTLVNRNFARSAAQATTNVRYGIELTSKIDSIQTQQFTLSHTIQFPRLVPRMTWIPQSAREDARTFLSLNLGYTDRINYYLIKTFNTSWGYEFNWKKLILGIRLPNIEYNLLQKRSGLQTLIDSNASYKYIFNDGLVISTLVNVTLAGGKKNISNIARFGVEESGLVSGIFQPYFPNSRLYRFVKLDAEFVSTKKIRRTALAWRVFGGVGYGLPFATANGKIDSSNLYMPFFRQYYGGGPNSMRAWALRKLGPGSTVRSFSRYIAPDRFGDIRLEMNGEYRFYLTQIFGFPAEGALFTDIGNVWFLRKNLDFPNGEFKINRLWKDLAIGAGTGFRWDFGFLKLRLDYAYKVKNPSPDASDPGSQNKWFYKWQLLNGQLQVGINYPF